MTAVLSYHNDAAVKERIVEQAKRHLAADMLLKGAYANDEGEIFRGCSVLDSESFYALVGRICNDESLSAPEREDARQDLRALLKPNLGAH